MITQTYQVYDNTATMRRELWFCDYNIPIKLYCCVSLDALMQEPKVFPREPEWGTNPDIPRGR